VKDRIKLSININKKEVKRYNVKDEARLRNDEEAKDSSRSEPRPSNSSWSSNEDIEVDDLD
jgi:hypothetical protein